MANNIGLYPIEAILQQIELRNDVVGAYSEEDTVLTNEHVSVQEHISSLGNNLSIQPSYNVYNFMNNQNSSRLYHSDSSNDSFSDSSDDNTNYSTMSTQFFATEMLNSNENSEEDDSENSEEYINKSIIDKYCIKKKLKNLKHYKQSCAICQNDYKKKDNILLLPCSHSFHQDCIKPWFKKNINCPNCRNDVIEQNNLIKKLEKCKSLKDFHNEIEKIKIKINNWEQNIQKIDRIDNKKKGKKKNK